MSYSQYLCEFFYRTALTLFQLVSGGKDYKHFITVPWAFPNANFLEFHLVTTTIFSSFSI